MKKYAFTICLMLALLLNTAWARDTGLVYHEVQVVDERGENVTDINSVYIYAPDTTTDAVIYSDKKLTVTITIPMTENSPNTTLVDGFVSWYGPDGYDFSMSNDAGVGPLTNANHRTRTSSEGTLVFPSYMTAISSTSYTDAQSITMGDGSDWVINGGGVAKTLRFTPASDDSTVTIGTSGTGLNSSFNVYQGTSLGLKIDSTGPTFTWDGGIANLNVSSDFATNINTGTSTGAINIGSGTGTGAMTFGNSAGGAISFDTTSTATYNSDANTSITTTDAGADIILDAPLGSILIDSGEAAADAITLVCTGAAGGIDITSLADIDITTTGAATEDITLTNTGGSVIITATEVASDSINIDGTGIDIDSTDDISIIATGVGDACDITIHQETTADSSLILSSDGTGADALSIFTGGAAGDVKILSVDNIDIDAADDIAVDTADGAITITAAGSSAGDMTLTVGDDFTLAVTGATVLPDDVLLKATVAVTAAEANNLAASPKELIAAVAGKMHEFVKIVVSLDFGTGAWTESDDNLAVRYTDGSGVVVSDVIEATGLADATEDTVCFAGPAPTTSALVTEVASTNKALVLDNTGNGEWGGAGDGALQAIIYYRTHTTAELGL